MIVSCLLFISHQEYLLVLGIRGIIQKIDCDKFSFSEEPKKENEGT